MSGFVQGGIAIRDGDNLMVQGVKPAGIAAQGQVIWSGKPQWKLLNIVNSPGITGITPAMDTGGADLLVALLAGSSALVLGITDSLSNTWTAATGNGTGCAFSSIWYCISPFTGPTHVFTGVSLSYGGLIVAAFRCVGGIPLFSNQSNAATNVNGQTSIQLPFITANQGDLILTSITNCGGNLLSIDSNFNIDKNISRVAGGTVAYASASLISNSSQSVYPTWNGDFSVYPTNPSLATAMASFTSNPIPSAAWQLLTSVIAMGGGTSITAPIDTTGANLLVIISINRGVASSGSSFSDSQNNSWLRAVETLNPSVASGSSIFYSLNPITSSAHTFIGNQTAYSGLIVMAFKGPPSIAADQTSSAVNTSGTSLQLNSLTPSANDSLIIAGLTHFSYVIPSIDSGFIIRVNQPYAPNNGGAVAILLQNSIASVAPTWTLASAQYPGMSSAIMNFIPVP